MPVLVELMNWVFTFMPLSVLWDYICFTFWICTNNSRLQTIRKRYTEKCFIDIKKCYDKIYIIKPGRTSKSSISEIHRFCFVCVWQDDFLCKILILFIILWRCRVCGNLVLFWNERHFCAKKKIVRICICSDGG